MSSIASDTIQLPQTMSTHLFHSTLLVFLFVSGDFTNSKVHYYITPSLNVPCPQDPCLTLSQFAAYSSVYVNNKTSMSLFFLPGNHSLNIEISLVYADNILMIKDAQYNETVFVECIYQSITKVQYQ